MNSMPSDAMTGRALSAVATVTRPAPARNAARAARAAAPVFPTEPARIRTCPKVPLCASSFRGRAIHATSSPRVRFRKSSGYSSRASGGVPICLTTHSPTASQAGGKTCASLGAVNVTEASARTCSPINWPLSAEAPEGRSTATVRAPANASFKSRTTSSRKPSSGFESPVPRMASISNVVPLRPPFTRCQAAESSAVSGAPDAIRRSRLTAASPFTFFGSASNMTRGVSPCSRSRRATTRPSPPLFPRPHTMAIFCPPSGAKRSARNSSTPRPAFSISVRLGTPYRSVVMRSMRCICAAVSIFMNSRISLSLVGQYFSLSVGSVQTQKTEKLTN